MEDNLEFLKKRFSELAERSIRENRYTYTQFLGIAETALFKKYEKDYAYASPSLFGGMDGCERLILRFGSESELGYEEPWPIMLLCISALQEKFADELNHRDFLGSIIGLGIEREKIGDIFIKDNKGYAFVHSSLSSFIAEELASVKHTAVRVEELTEIPDSLRPELEEVSLVVSSDRLDGIIAKLFKLSRDEAQRLVKSGLVFVDGAEINSASRALKEGEIISVRHHGRFRFAGENGQTKKDRLSVRIQKYI